ncbi:single-strand DNA-binding protein [Agromyces sp. CF514]|uniref:single-stranded DNA-binding protein n=1 Tax=Agromyces sp. CF514 TaxID=1881031 RepID=UPI0008EFDE5F|nr:single-stranded DNA-binding protein [Agromyces sp. CF514]SFR76278.1 single-strand DNA-binding protein [Agromyces sp. CF514]
MTDNITVIGAVGSDPRVHTTPQGLTITSFRLASTRRVYDRAKGTWEDGDTNWYTVSTFRQLAKNASASIRRGDRVVVHGRLRLRSWESGEKAGTAIEIDAEAVGHDLTWGTTSLSKTRSTASSGAPDASAAGDATATADGWPTDSTEPSVELDARAVAAFASDDDSAEGLADASDGERILDDHTAALPF